MLFLHEFNCVSPQPTFPADSLEQLNHPVGNKLTAVEPSYEKIPPGILRRMSKPVRLGIGASLPLLKEGVKLNGIVIGTANAGMEDCFYFLKQLIEYNEGLLTPGNFVQSTPNALAAQVAMLHRNNGYNTTHVHLGLAFENALTDALLLTEEHPEDTYLVGAVDDISTYNYNINLSDGWYKDEPPSMDNFYTTDTKGSIPGEGSAMFLVSGLAQSALAALKGLETLHSADELMVQERTREFLFNSLPAGENIDLLISGENGDNRLAPYYLSCETCISPDAGIVRYKHMSGEYPTASAMALWLACHFLKSNPIPGHMVKRAGTSRLKNILIYNCFKKTQHSLMLVSGL